MGNMCYINVNALKNIFEILALIVSIAALIIACCIPHRVMVNQIYADLLSQYRSTEMGAAIFSVFQFYVNECKRNPALIAEKYKKRYKEEIKDKLPKSDAEENCGNEYQEINFQNTLHFKRRLIEQWYFHLATLRYDYKFMNLRARKLKEDFTYVESRLLLIIYYMGLAAKGLFEDSGDIDPPIDCGDTNGIEQKIYKLYEESVNWE
ncbi:hypothetical protein [Leadbettera azotonutricia]|uniref:Uncharacterized protein n=1 Tax=Leadbettera azotonutricia (strain ATCC BAA-888 / DSM 13862 / ZAS-9) TaxID=545695 RepID=F5Y9A4_LEAAZ|nr:hypothetical protein [Leadbettera azotonutricia]AEF82859.1 hypothetical protein TREAZ_2157 [Leadbettera azotonutricia ZAS-9]